jgi:hypothetical protein
VISVQLGDGARAVISGLLNDAFRTKVATNGEKALAMATGVP